MDSLYINVIHSTTDLRGGLRKARDLARSAGDAAAAAAAAGVHDDDGGSSGRRQDSFGRGSGGRGGRGSHKSGGSHGREEEEEEEEEGYTHKDIMFFPYGAVVFWGCSEKEVRAKRRGMEE